MSKRPTKYRRCKKCKELVIDPEHCANCANANPLSLTRRSISEGLRGRPTLDVQEGNGE
jgi:hypothetical protein